MDISRPSTSTRMPPWARRNRRGPLASSTLFSLGSCSSTPTPSASSPHLTRCGYWRGWAGRRMPAPDQLTSPHLSIRSSDLTPRRPDADAAANSLGAATRSPPWPSSVGVGRDEAVDLKASWLGRSRPVNSCSPTAATSTRLIVFLASYLLSNLNKCKLHVGAG